MLTKKELLTIFIALALLFIIGALIYTPIVQNQLGKHARAELEAAGFKNVHVSFRGQDAHLTGEINDESERDQIASIVNESLVPIRFRSSGKNAIRTVNTSRLGVPSAASSGTSDTHLAAEGEPFVTITAYGDKILRIDGSVAKDSEKQRLTQALRAKYRGYVVDTKNVSVSYANRPATDAGNVAQLPAPSPSSATTYFAAGKLDGNWRSYPGKTVSRISIEQDLSRQFPRHDPPMAGLEALLAWRSAPKQTSTPNTNILASRPPTTTPSRPQINPRVPPLVRPSTPTAKPATKPPSPSSITRIIKPAPPSVRTPVRPATRPQPPAISTTVQTPRPPSRIVTPKPTVPSTAVVPKPRVVPTKPSALTATAVRTSPQTMLIGRLSFDTGASSLSRQQKAYGLRLIKTFLKRRPNAIIQIIGHTDNVGAAETNRKVSRDRAASVRDFLVSEGVQPNKILFTGRGEIEPIADNNTASGRSKNRRVDLLARF